MFLTSKLSIVLLSALSAAAEPKPPIGPLPVGLLAPRFAPHLLLPALPPPPEPDGIRISLDAGTGQVWKGDSGPGGAVGINAQTVMLRFAGQWSLAPILSAGWEIPFLFHARSFKRGEDPFHVGIEYGGVVLADAHDPIGGISDACLSLSLHHWNPEDPLRLLRLTACLKVPSGGRQGYVGTGRAEFGGMLDFSWDTRRRIFFHGRVGLVRVGDPEDRWGEKVDMGLAIPFRAALEWRPSGSVGVHLQLEGSNNFHPVTDHERLDEHPVQLTAGVSYQPHPGVAFWLSFSEDVTRGAPDFAVCAGLMAALR
jgi:hypothetical protein